MLKAKISTPSYMIYGQLGLTPLSCLIKKRLVSYWLKLVTGNRDKLAYRLYEILLSESNADNNNSKWIELVKNTLNSIGFSQVWINQNYQISTSITSIHKRLEDITQQQIEEQARQSNKGKNYIILKEEWRQEKYFNILDYSKTITLFHFRTANHRLPIETGRFSNIEYKNRTCQECREDIGDEYHYLMKCPVFDIERKKYLTAHYRKHPNMIKYIQLMTCDNVSVLNKICTFMNIIMHRIKT